MKVKNGMVGVAHHLGGDDVHRRAVGAVRQDHVGVAGRLVPVDVDAHHEVEFAERTIETFTVGSAQHRITRHGDERLDALVAGFGDLLGQRRHRVGLHEQRRRDAGLHGHCVDAVFGGRQLHRRERSVAVWRGVHGGRHRKSHHRWRIGR